MLTGVALIRSNGETRGSCKRTAGQTDVAVTCKLKTLPEARCGQSLRLALPVLLLECLVFAAEDRNYDWEAVPGPESYLLIALHLVSPNKHPELRVRDPLAALQHARHCHKVLYHRQLVAVDGPLPSIALQSPAWPLRYMNSLDDDRC